MTKRVNAGLPAYLVFVTGVSAFSEPERRTPVGDLLDAWPLAGSFLVVVLVCLILAGATVIVRIFWNRFIADVFGTRSITTQEALSIVLLGILVAG